MPDPNAKIKRVCVIQHTQAAGLSRVATITGVDAYLHHHTHGVILSPVVLDATLYGLNGTVIVAPCANPTEKEMFSLGGGALYTYTDNVRNFNVNAYTGEFENDPPFEVPVETDQLVISSTVTIPAGMTQPALWAVITHVWYVGTNNVVYV